MTETSGYEIDASKSLAILVELCNPKLTRHEQIPHRTADRENPKLALGKWQPSHNIGESRTEKHTSQCFSDYFSTPPPNQDFTVGTSPSPSPNRNFFNFVLALIIEWVC